MENLERKKSNAKRGAERIFDHQWPTTAAFKLKVFDLKRGQKIQTPPPPNFWMLDAHRVDCYIYPFIKVVFSTVVK